MAEHTPHPSPRRVAVLTVLAMTAFASNSILCRLALATHAIDAATFTGVRVASGALMLSLILRLRRPRPALTSVRGSWSAAAFLFAYAIAFSVAYTWLPSGTGALILFGCVQATLLVAALRSGERPRALEVTGLAVAMAGLLVLTAPGLAAPAPLGSALMAMAGVAWGLYTLRGRGSVDPQGDTAGNFVRAVPMAVAVFALATREAHVSTRGVVLAAASGAIASGVGYTIWYAALRGLTRTRAATVQLSVPALVALGGVVLLGELLTPRIVAAGALILGGVGVALASRAAGTSRRAPERRA